MERYARNIPTAPKSKTKSIRLIRRTPCWSLASATSGSSGRASRLSGVSRIMLRCMASTDYGRFVSRLLPMLRDARVARSSA